MEREDLSDDVETEDDDVEIEDFPQKQLLPEIIYRDPIPEDDAGKKPERVKVDLQKSNIDVGM